MIVEAQQRPSDAAMLAETIVIGWTRAAMEMLAAVNVATTPAQGSRQ